MKALTLQRKKTLENEKASYGYQLVGLILKMTILPESIMTQWNSNKILFFHRTRKKLC